MQEKKDTYHFLPGLEHTQLAKADVEGGRHESAVVLLDDEDVDGPSQGGRIDFAVPLRKGLDERVGNKITHSSPGDITVLIDDVTGLKCERMRLVILSRLLC